MHVAAESTAQQLWLPAGLWFTHGTRELLYPLQALGALTVLGVHIGKHVAKWSTGAPFEPVTGAAWAIGELVVTAIVVALGVWALT